MSISENLSSLYISQSFHRLLQINPNNNIVMLDGTGSEVSNLTIGGVFSSSYLYGDGRTIYNITGSNISNFKADVSASAAFYGFGASGAGGETNQNAFSFVQISGSTIEADSKTDTLIIEGGDYVTLIPNVGGDSFSINVNLPSNLISSSAQITALPTSSITNFDTSVSSSAAAYGFGAGGGVTNYNDLSNIPSSIVSSSSQTLSNLVGQTINVSNVLSTNGGFTGNVIVDGTLTAREFVVSSSVMIVTTSYSSGSTSFGNTIDDLHSFTGSLSISGSLYVNGSDISSGSSVTFDGNRTVSRTGIAQVNVGTTTTLKDFIEEYFFPFNSATLSISGTSTYETGSSQNITITISISENSETSFSNGSLRNLTDNIVVDTFTTDDSAIDNSVTYNTSYSASIDVDNNGSPTTIHSNTITANFIYPYFYGMHPSSSLSGTDLYTELTKVVASQGDKTLSYNDTDKYIYFVVPASWSNVDTILDPNSFNVTNSFTTSSVSVTSTGLTTNYTETFKVYRSSLTTANGNFQFQF